MPAVAKLPHVYSKIDRAKKHVAELQLCFDEFAHANPCRVVAEYDEKSGRLNIVVRDWKDPPAEFGLIAGEAIHQLRSALDHIVWLLFERARVRPPGRQTGFPIFHEGGKKYEAEGKAKIRGLSAELSARIEGFQPFKRSLAPKDDLLWLLHDLNNTDKHRVLLVTQAYIGHGAADFFFEPEIKIAKGRSYSLTVDGPLKPGAILCWFETEQRKVTVTGKVAVAVGLVDVGTAKYQPAIPFLNQLSDYVREIATNFEPDFEKPL
jgi:hypothetical protein